ncbi:glycosyltransferase family 4 protein [uncultured Bacteroides sp.]|uniref:glycosyltransferase family 4 protein n=1 Tax=uncultured Bacteroides sp. TaxID=162156 RepID=UPI002AA619DD|nr:glycosyltransferase family 4 protein [uncultured Bacteroides sp.]
MKIVYLMPELVGAGGADRVIIEKANYFAKQFGYEVYLITTYQKNRPFFYRPDDEVKYIDLNIDFPSQYNHSILKRGIIYFQLIREYKTKLSKILNDIKPDFTITTINRDIDVLHSINDGSKKIAEAHVSKDFARNLHQFSNRGMLYKLIGYFLKKRVWKSIRKFDGLVVLTHEDAQRWQKIKQATVIPNALPFYPEQSSNCKEKKIISVGRIAEQKGYDLLLEAWEIVIEKHPDWSIYIYGDGELQEELSNAIDHKKLDESFKIVAPTKNIISKYLESSFYVMSSRFEGFGMVLIEAMSCGLPCVSFNCPSGPSEIISDKEDGLLIENGNIEKLANGICFLIENEQTRIDWGQNARKNVKRFLPENVMLEWKRYFESK